MRFRMVLFRLFGSGIVLKGLIDISSPLVSAHRRDCGKRRRPVSPRGSLSKKGKTKEAAELKETLAQDDSFSGTEDAKKALAGMQGDYLRGPYTMKIAKSTAPSRVTADRSFTRARALEGRSATWMTIAGMVFRTIITSSRNARFLA